ncbi:MAG: hypothetical protein ACM3ZT_08760 [Bacillota bacterium]
MGEKDWVPVTGPMYLKEAGIICAVLGEAGIPNKQAEPNGQRYHAFAPQLDTAEVLVPKDHLEKARALLEAKEKDAEK